MSAPPSWQARLADRIAATGTVLCVGLDPDPAALPRGFPSDVRGVEAFARLVLEAAGPHAAAVKANLAFFEAFGAPGMAALERIRAAAPEDLPFIADAKRGDIGTTSARHATALFDVLDAHAVTVTPFVGEEGLAPLLARPERGVYVLCRTSNPGAGEFQDTMLAPGPDGAPAEPLYHRVARHAVAWQARHGTIGLVVGATAPAELAAIRALAPGLPFLVPGVGAQGGDAAAVLADGAAAAGPWAADPGRGLLVNVSRGIAAAAMTAADPGAALAAAAAEWGARLRCYDGGPLQRTPLEVLDRHA